ncbi:MAG TPA: cupin domain-containing protein [Blastocatellia bacterium]|nr:cupin domain-containing protein [Blastocatellia bacterium]HMZ20298.1 cupin domain-containing protein [Blastocatellia bacterium]HNG28785.1 cupin domain-containing protein [Blastocatellia bacterium]
MDIQVFSIRQVCDQITQAYAPVTLANVDDFAIRLVKFQGEFERWHAHDNEDESFIVLEGEILFQTEQGDFLLKGGEGIVIPKGLRHCPKAADEGAMPLALIIERAETKRLGD